MLLRHSLASPLFLLTITSVTGDCDADDNCAATTEVNLLQVGLNVEESTLDNPSVAKVHHSTCEDASIMLRGTGGALCNLALPAFGLSQYSNDTGAMYWTTCHKGQCYLNMPNVTSWKDLTGSKRYDVTWGEVGSEPTRSSFVFGKLPKILDTGKALRAPMFYQFPLNPGLAKMPSQLRDVFPDGRFLSVLPFVPEYNTMLQVLNADLEVVGETKIELDSDIDLGFKFQYFGDPRILTLNNGDLLLAFSAYKLAWRRPYCEDANWMTHMALTQLHVKAQHPQSLKAWVNRNETMLIDECPEQGYHAPGPKKNLGFFEHKSGVHVLDWIFPTKIGKLDMKAKQVGFESYFSKVCLHDSREPPTPKDVPWSGIVGQEALKPAHQLTLSNSATLVWVEESKEYLGIGHLKRHFASKEYECYPWWGNHYTFIYYTLAQDPPFNIQRVGESEFCFQSATLKVRDCDSVQFVSSMVRDGPHLYIGYGVNDHEAYVATLNITDVLGTLRAV